MPMAGTLGVLNRMVREGVVSTYALAGAVAAYNYIAPAVTEDLDVLVTLPAGGKRTGLVTLGPILSWLSAAGYTQFRKEGVEIEGWAVQFLPVADALDEAALAEAETVHATLGGKSIATRVLRPEHLVATALRVGRPKDLARILQFIEEDAVNVPVLCSVLSRFHLGGAWQHFCRRFGIDNPCGITSDE